MSPSGRALAEALTPSSDVDEVRRAQAITAEAKALQRLKPNFALGRLDEIGPFVRAASRGGLLMPPDLQSVAVFLRTARHARRHLAPLSRELPNLAGMARRIGEFDPLIAAIERTLDERGEVKDSASPALPGLRHAIRVQHDRLLAQVERILKRAVSDGIAQESLVTERDGRYVIPIKAESRSALPSVVHDVSSSGATVFVEPLAAVELGNRWREARLEEEREVARVLRQLSQRVGESAGEIGASATALGQIDFAAAKAKLAQAMDAPLPSAEGTLEWIVEGPDELRLQTARHPLLTGDVVPISIVAGGDSPSVLVTGPNTGGKTVALKTVGLLALMAQAGLPIPAEPGTQLPVYDGLYADIGDEQSIEQSLSTFSSHMTNIIRVLGEAGGNSLVLFDELGAGTDPTEGAALGRAILTRLLELGATVIATTHHSELKLFAHETEGLRNASVEFDSATLAPTYRLTMGLPGRSNAIAIARRLGMPASVLDQAEAGFSPDEASVENLLADLQEQRAAAADARQAEELARGEAEEIRHGLRERREAIETERGGLIARTENEMERELIALRRAVRAAERELRKGRKEAIVEAQQRMAEAERRLETVRHERLSVERRRERERAGPRPEPVSIRPGQVLYLEGVQQAGEAITAVDADGYLEVQLGSLRTRVQADQVVRLGRARPDAAPTPLPPPAMDPGSRIEIRGQTMDEALPAVEAFIDQAYRAGQSRLEVVHGKGTGTLRRAVRAMLGEHPLVSGYEAAERREGGDGVTIVQLAV